MTTGIQPDSKCRAMLMGHYEKKVPYYTYIQIINSTFAPNFFNAAGIACVALGIMGYYDNRSMQHTYLRLIITLL